MADVVLDTKGLNCPLPILKAKKALKKMASGGLLEVHATDPGATADFEAFCRQTGCELHGIGRGRRGVSVRDQECVKNIYYQYVIVINCSLKSG